MSEKKINDLTPEQDARLDALAIEWEERVLSGDDSYDLDALVAGIDFVYGLIELKSPQIVVCTSPLDLCEQAQIKEGETFDCLGSGFDSGWTSFYDCMRSVVGVEFDEDCGFDVWLRFIKNAGVFATVLCEEVAFVCVKPCAVRRNDAGDLHSETGPAIEWRDGYGQFYLNGVAVSEELVTTPANALDPYLLLKEQNVEVRREIVRKIGIDTVVAKLGAEVLDSQGDYALLLLDLGDGRRRPYLKMLNPSTGTWHVEGVDPRCETVASALTWRNGTDTRPSVLT
jgi:hypothetical protein